MMPGPPPVTNPVDLDDLVRAQEAALKRAAAALREAAAGQAYAETQVRRYPLKVGMSFSSWVTTMIAVSNLRAGALPSV